MWSFGVKVLDCEVQWPGFGKMTLAVALAVGLWSLQFLFGLGSKTTVSAGASLVAMVFGCVSNAIGINITKGWKPLLLNIICFAIVFLVYNLIASLLTG